MHAEAVFPQRFPIWHLVSASLIVLAAFALRVGVMGERAANDPSFIPQAGLDHHTYLMQGAARYHGDVPDEPHYFHPGPSYAFAAIFTLLGSTDWMRLTVVIALLDALTVGLLIASGWLLTRVAWGGYLAGTLYALYPVAIFYATTPLIAPLAAFLLAAFVLLILWQRDKLTFWRTVLLGVVMGALALSRLNLVPLAGLYGLWLLVQNTAWSRRIAHAGLFVLMMAATIAPTTWHNYVTSDGRLVLVATTGSEELYMANNRDSGGLHGRTPADLARDRSIPLSMLRDIQIAPEHFLGLMGYKLALFWSGLEPGNNLNYATSRDASAILSALRPYDFVVLLVGGMIGLRLLWRDQRGMAALLGATVAWLMVSYLVAFIFGRLRFPAVIPLTLLTSYGVYGLRALWHERVMPRHWLALVGAPLLACLLLIGFSQWVRTPDLKLPPERTYGALPADAIRLDADFGDTVRLVGWRPIDAWPAAHDGWVPLLEAYGVELFWQIQQPTEIAYNFFIAYVDGGVRYSSLDQQLGGVSFPARPTDGWQVGQIYGEIVSLRFDAGVPTQRSGQIRVGVWYWDDEGLIVNVPLNDGEANLLLQSLAVFDLIAPEHAIPPLDAPVIFADLIALKGYTLPASGQAGDTIALDFHWEGLAAIGQNYSLFLHVIDEDEMIVTQGDAPPAGALSTSNWQPRFPILNTSTLTLPQQAGRYRVYAGLYDANGRLPLANGKDRLLLGTIDIVSD